jgi:putative transcriptional regulator
LRPLSLGCAGVCFCCLLPRFWREAGEGACERLIDYAIGVYACSSVKEIHARQTCLIIVRRPGREEIKNSDFQGIVQGLKETAAFLQGEAKAVQIDMAAIRRKTALSQSRFAEIIGVSIGTLRNWEQGRRVPDGSARVLLAMLAKNPRIVEEVLAVA